VRRATAAAALRGAGARCCGFRPAHERPAV